MGYLLDADVFIRAKNLHYGFDFCPAFWDWLVGQNSAGKVFSIEKVDADLQAGEDELSQWAQDRGSAFFLPLESSVVPAMGQVSQWVSDTKGNGTRYTPAAISTFLQASDYYLVAQALAWGHVVVTHETPAPLAVHRVKIPDACIGLRVQFMNPHDMLRSERARFVLGKKP